MSEYQVGGSLSANATSYVIRQADTQLAQALNRGEFCYVFNCRQMGKSSLRVQTKKRLEEQGYACVSIDMTNIGSNGISVLQWYKSIASELWRGFNLIGKVKFKDWWAGHGELSPVQQLNHFISDVILPEVKAQRLFIFIDEIDSVISLDFSTDDFFALIRYFYNARAEHPDFKRLSFALFGVATPSDLISDRTRTPFNIGTAIELKGFTLNEASALIGGFQDCFVNPEVVLEEILGWTGGQPFLTQKLCKLAIEKAQADNLCPLRDIEVSWVEDLVKNEIIEDWEAQDEPEHLKTIRDRLLRNEKKATLLLGLSEKIFRNGFIAADDSPEQRDLLLSNLVIKKRGQLIPRNLVYQQIFNLDWIEQQQDKLNPFNRQLEFWEASGREDKSRLLRGKALEEGRIWASDRNLSQLEYQFLSASQEQEQEVIRQNLELERLREIETRLFQEQKLAKTQRFLLGTIGAGFLITTVLGIMVFKNYRQAKIREIEAHINASNSAYDNDSRFEALIHAIEAKEEANTFNGVDLVTRRETDSALRQASYNVVEKNTFSGHKDIILDVAFSPDSQTIVSASADNTIKVWQPDGKLLKTLTGHKDTVLDVAFSPDGKIIASASQDNSVKLWNRQGKLLQTLTGYGGGVNQVAFSPDGKFLATASEDKTVRLSNLEGKLINVFLGHNSGILELTFNHEGNMVATGDRNGILKIWNLNGEQIRSFPAHSFPLRGIDFAQGDRQLVSVGDDNLVKIWNINGKLIKTMTGFDAPVTDVKFSPDGKTIATSSWDGTVKLWSKDGWLNSNFQGHQARVWGLSWSKDSSTIATAGWDNVVKTWQVKDPLVKTFYGHTNSVLSVAFHPQNQLFASASVDGTVKIWHTDGELVTNFTDHDTEAYDVSFSPDGKLVASSSYDRTVKLWRTDGKILDSITNADTVIDVNFTPDSQTIIFGGYDNKMQFWQIKRKAHATALKFRRSIIAHQARIADINISGDGKLIASASHDRYVKLWHPNGKLIRSFVADETGVRAVEISPDLSFIATGGKEQNIKLWNLQGELMRIFKGHEAMVLDLEISPDGSKLASASADNTVKIWDLQGNLLTTLRGHQGGVWNVNFDREGKHIVTASEDRTVKLWDLERILELDTLEYACDWVEDYLKTNPDLQHKEHQHLCNL